MSKLQIGLIGLGYFGGNYVRILKDHPDAELVAICDPNPKAFEKLKEKMPNVEFTTDFSKVKLDGVIICTPVSTHYELAKKCLENGLHVLCEKPLCDDGVKSQELVLLATQHRLKLLTGHTFIYNAMVRHIKKLLDEKQLGEILYMTFQRTGKSPIRNDCNSLVDLSTHDISMALYFLDEMPKSVSCYGKSYLQTGIEDCCFTHMEFSNNVTAHLHSSWFEPIKQRKVTIVGREKMLTFDDVKRELIVYHDNYQYVQNIEYHEPLKEQVNDFIRSILQDTQPIVNAMDGHKVVCVLEAANESLKNNSQKIEVW